MASSATAPPCLPSQQRRRIFPTLPPSTQQPCHKVEGAAQTIEGTEYMVKIHGSTPSSTAACTTSETRPTATQKEAQPVAPQQNHHLRRRTHSDPDTFAVFTAAEGSTFGKSDSFTYLQALGDDTVNDPPPPQEEIAAQNDLGLGMNYEYSDDEEEDVEMRNALDRPLNDVEIVQLSHPLASIAT